MNIVALLTEGRERKLLMLPSLTTIFVGMKPQMSFLTSNRVIGHYEIKEFWRQR